MPFLIASIGALLFSALPPAIGSLSGWANASTESLDVISAQKLLPEKPSTPQESIPTGSGHPRLKEAGCKECGFVESIRQIAPEGDSPALREITIRLRDGSTRVYSDVDPVRWRTGERILVIAGGYPPVR